jgi:hypothetical protein
MRRAILIITLLVSSLVRGDELVVRAAFPQDQWLDRRSPLELELSRALAPGEGRLVVFAGETDITGIFLASPTGLVHSPSHLPLPPGEHQLVVYLVSADGATWTEKVRAPLKVRTRGGLDRGTFDPGLDLSNKGQLEASQRPEEALSSRVQFQDATIQGGWKTEMQRNDFVFRSNLNVTGVTYINEALRFGQLGSHAPRVDLSSYDLQFEKGPARIALGHVTFGGHKHLINGFGSRGLLLNVALGKALSLQLAGINGTSIVGWDNFLGISNHDHRMLGAGVAVELVPSRPGAARIESWFLDGSLQPLNDFNQGAIRSAEKSRGNAWRMLLSDRTQRVTFEGGYTTSRFREAQDLQLEEGLPVTPLDETTRDAAYGDLSVALIRNRTLGKSTAVNVVAGIHFERVDPLYRSIGAFTQADVERLSADLAATIGPLTMQVSHGSMQDNLAGIASILTTNTDQTTAAASIALSSFVKKPSRAIWMPALVATFSRTHQFGEGVPENSGFSPSHVPDQMSTSATFGASWSWSRVRFAYQWNLSRQDNRQPGRERADFHADSSGVTVDFTPLTRLTFGLNLSRDQQRNLEVDRTDRNTRAGTTLTWRVFGDTALATSYGISRSRDAARTSENNSSDSYVELSSGLRLWQSPAQPSRARLFLRYANRDADSFDRTFGTSDRRRGWTLTSGVNMNVF